nr:hypothetical protein [Phenylobacterium sp.]
MRSRETRTEPPELTAGQAKRVATPCFYIHDEYRCWVTGGFVPVVVGERIASARTELAAAPWQQERWPTAIRLLAEATGGWCGHMAGATTENAYIFSIDGGLPDGLLDAWIGRGGTDERINPRAQAIFAAPDFAVLGDEDFIDQRSRSRHPLYQEVYAPFDVAQSLITKAPLPAGSAVFASMRPESMGPFTGADRRALRLLTRDLSAAIFLQSRLEASAVELAAGVMANLGIGAFFLDAGCRVTAMTAVGETLLGEGDIVRLRSRRLEVVNQDDDVRLQAAIAAISNRERGAVEIVLGSAGDEARARANVSRLPSAGPLGTFTFAVTVTRGALRPSGLIEAGLTRSEAAIALALVDGDRPMDIALARGVSINTIRSQVREVYSKLGVTGVGSLARRVAGIGGAPDDRR